jgi:hypothetical protein
VVPVTSAALGNVPIFLDIISVIVCITDLWVTTQCNFVGEYQQYGGMYYLQLQGSDSYCNIYVYYAYYYAYCYHFLSLLLLSS